MLIYYIRSAWRNLRKNISYSLINIIGLSLGIASILLIFLYMQHEFSYDDYHTKKERIYRLLEYNSQDGAPESIIETHLIEEMRTSFTGIEDAVSLARPVRCFPMTITVENKQFENIDVRCTESNIFNIFSFPLATGNIESILDAPNAAVISRSLAQKIFGQENPVGKTFEKKTLFGSEKTFEITGVMEDIPEKTHFNADLFISYHSLTRDDQRQAHSMYVLLNKDADKETISEQALEYMKNQPGQGSVQKIELQPVEDIYLSGTFAEKQGNIQYIYILSAIALIILIIACANYMNLATARYSQRSKEIGVRKVLGAHRAQLVRQFLFETVLLTLLTLPFAIILVGFALPYFNFYVGTSLNLAVTQTLYFYLASAGIAIGTGLLAGSYPAFVSSALQPKEVIAGAGKTSFSFTGNRLRKGLVGLQFLASIFLIGMTALIIQQLSYVQDKDLGFNPQNIMTVSINNQFMRQDYNIIKQRFNDLSQVQNVTASPAPGTGNFAGVRVTVNLSLGNNEETYINRQAIDPDFLSVMNIPLLAGRNISNQINDSTLTQEVLINEAAVELLQLKNIDQAVGSTIDGQYRIVGVIKDFQLKSLKHRIEPVLLTQIPNRGASSLSIQFKNQNFTTNIEDLRKAWTEAGGTASDFSYRILEDQIEQQYAEEQRAAKVIGVFAFISIVIACLGLFGLAAFIAQQRMKEIGIRKVLGASTTNILVLLYKDFGKLIGIATLIAIPIIYFTASKWLQNFAYRTDIGLGIILIPLVIVVLVSIISTSSNSIKAALMNPVDSIRNE